jgi:hypothetical protein
MHPASQLQVLGKTWRLGGRPSLVPWLESRVESFDTLSDDTLSDTLSAVESFDTLSETPSRRDTLSAGNQGVVASDLSMSITRPPADTFKVEEVLAYHYTVERTEGGAALVRMALVLWLTNPGTRPWGRLGPR